MIAIIEYGSGNVGAIANIYKHLKIPFKITSNLSELEGADRYILPGVGAFDATMESLRESGTLDLLNQEVLVKKKNILGICVGMQVLADSSEEGVEKGLGWIDGHVRKIPRSVGTEEILLPHMGWNSITPRTNTKLLEHIDVDYGFYFLHSYFFDVEHESDGICTVDYGNQFVCAVQRENIYGVQFHPEKSHINGMTIFKNFAALP